MAKGKPTIEELIAFTRSEGYTKAWKPAIHGYGKIGGFNFAAFFFSVIWLAYRKMYRYAIKCYAILIAASFIQTVVFQGFLNVKPPTWITNLIGLVIAIICGINGNRWYFTYASREISKIRSQNLPDGEALIRIAKKGGTDFWLALGLFIIYLIVAFIIVFIVLFMLEII